MSAAPSDSLPRSVAASSTRSPQTVPRNTHGLYGSAPRDTTGYLANIRQDAHVTTYPLCVTPSRELGTVYESLTRENSGVLGSVPREIPFALGSPISRDVPKSMYKIFITCLQQMTSIVRLRTSEAHRHACCTAAFALGSYGDRQPGESPLDYYSMFAVCPTSHHHCPSLSANMSFSNLRLLYSVLQWAPRDLQRDLRRLAGQMARSRETAVSKSTCPVYLLLWPTRRHPRPGPVC